MLCFFRFHIFADGSVDTQVEFTIQDVLYLEQPLQIVHGVIRCLCLLCRLCHSCDELFTAAKLKRFCQTRVIISSNYLIISCNVT